MPRVEQNEPYPRRAMQPVHSHLGRLPTPTLTANHFLRQIEARHIRTPSSPPAILHYDFGTRSLAHWPWYLFLHSLWPGDSETGRRLRPDELENHRRTHEFHAPCCLCAFLDGEEYTESVIGVVESLPLPRGNPDRNHTTMHGECGYFVCLERFYTLGGRMTLYRERGLEVEDLSTALDRHGSLWSDLMIGVTEARFWTLFVQCQLCKTVVLREPLSVFHECHLGQLTGRFVHRPSWVPQNRNRRNGPQGGPHEFDTDTEIVDSETSGSDSESDLEAVPLPAAASSDDPPTILEVLEVAFNRAPANI
ncbi:hypothetical protein DFP72DRAFT_843308 [Ephemerocybe angulata]|uniref:Uncharacterized protein n=1 Tax=Ephemerocybe angulata TaxID=980116 RepID=A0A8H6M9V7_9AGAR|nr:hypothetical protein DFP72DRAFT_843308 [Tulosesus angulatus]